MAVPRINANVSVRDYLAGEVVSETRHEYVNGQIFAMAGSSAAHNLIAGEFVFALKQHLRDTDCDVFFNDIKVRATNRVYYYPDVLVSCEGTPKDPYFRNSPILIVEVSSKSTVRTDRTEKLLYYQSMPSLKEYVIADQDRMNVEVHRRQSNGGWETYTFSDEADLVEFQSIGLSIPLPNLYRRVKFDPNANDED